MPRFHFNVYDGFTSRDAKGTELQDYAAARTMALRMASELLLEEGRLGDLGEEWRLEVTDHAGLVLFRLDFNITEAAAVAQTRD